MGDLCILSFHRRGAADRAVLKFGGCGGGCVVTVGLDNVYDESHARWRRFAAAASSAASSAAEAPSGCASGFAAEVPSGFAAEVPSGFAAEVPSGFAAEVPSGFAADSAAVADLKFLAAGGLIHFSVAGGAWVCEVLAAHAASSFSANVRAPARTGAACFRQLADLATQYTLAAPRAPSAQATPGGPAARFSAGEGPDPPNAEPGARYVSLKVDALQREFNAVFNFDARERNRRDWDAFFSAFRDAGTAELAYSLPRGWTLEFRTSEGVLALRLIGARGECLVHLQAEGVEADLRAAVDRIYSRSG
jgi:hypothetical protein